MFEDATFGSSATAGSVWADSKQCAAASPDGCVGDQQQLGSICRCSGGIDSIIQIKNKRIKLI
jgi:hypothetical protein